MLILADMDIGGILGVLFVLVFIVAPAVIGAVKQAKEKQQKGRSRPRGEGRPSSGNELTAFLNSNSLSGKAGASRPGQAARPAAAQRPKPRQAAVARPLRSAAPVQKTKAEAASWPAHAKKRKQLSRFRPIEKAKLKSLSVPVAPTARRTGAEALAAVLSKEPLKQAIVLREILGPCRAMRRHRPVRW